MLVGAGTVLGITLYALAAWDAFSLGGWIVAGITLVVGGWAISQFQRRGRPTVRPDPPPTPPTGSESPPPPVESIALELRAYSVVAFAAIGLFLTALKAETDEASARYLPDVLVFRYFDGAYIGLASLFFATAVLFLAGAVIPPAIRWFSNHREAHQWLHTLLSLFAWTGVALGFYGGWSIAMTLPRVLAYGYIYGGSLVALLVGVLWALDIGEMTRGRRFRS